MKILHFLASLFLLIILSSCSKGYYLLPPGTGAYSTVKKAKELTEPFSEKIPEEKVEESIITASSEDTYIVSTPKSISPSVQEATMVQTNTIAQKQIALKKDSKKTTIQKLAGLNNLKASVYQKDTAAPPKRNTDEGKRGVTSIVSFVCAVLGLLGFFAGLYLLLFLGLPAVIFGVIAFAKQEKYRGLAVTGLILGIVELVFIIGLIIWISIIF